MPKRPPSQPEPARAAQLSERHPLATRAATKPSLPQASRARSFSVTPAQTRNAILQRTPPASNNARAARQLASPLGSLLGVAFGTVLQSALDGAAAPRADAGGVGIDGLSAGAEAAVASDDKAAARVAKDAIDEADKAAARAAKDARKEAIAAREAVAEQVRRIQR